MEVSIAIGVPPQTLDGLVHGKAHYQWMMTRGTPHDETMGQMDVISQGRRPEESGSARFRIYFSSIHRFKLQNCSEQVFHLILQYYH